MRCVASQFQYGGGPALSENDYCIECIFEEAKAAASADSYRDQRNYMREVVDDVLAGHGLEGQSYYVARTWWVLSLLVALFVRRSKLRYF